MSNRFYDGMIYHIPQLVEPEGYKPEWAINAGIGVAFAPDETFADKLYAYYHGMEAAPFDLACEKELKRVIEEDNGYINMIDAFIDQ